MLYCSGICSAVLLHAILESKHAVMFLLVYTDHPHRHITAAHVQVFLCSCWSVHWNYCCACCSGNAHKQCPRDLPLPFPLPLGFSGAFLAPFLPSAAGAGGGGGNGGFKMILEPESALSGKSGYSPVSGSLFSRNHALICATNQRCYSSVSAFLLPRRHACICNPLCKVFAEDVEAVSLSRRSGRNYNLPCQY